MQASYAGVNVISSCSFIRPAMIRLELLLVRKGRRLSQLIRNPCWEILAIFCGRESSDESGNEEKKNNVIPDYVTTGTSLGFV